MEKSHQPWNGETGLIDQGMLGRYLKDAASPIYYIAGPPAMAKGLHEMLSKAGLNDNDIHAEEFSGY
jgi:Na+-transporting NADH:ubiquinone oxidoreductase subunit NqrF